MDHKVEGRIGPGIVALIGFAAGDTEKDADYLADKLIHLRIFSDPAGKMNLSAMETGAGLLLISQFTLYGDCRKGRRPGFDAAAPPEWPANSIGTLSTRFGNVDYSLRPVSFRRIWRSNLSTTAPSRCCSNPLPADRH